MSDQFEVSAELREDKGKGASRRLRRLADKVPAIIYGGGSDPQPLSLIRKDFEKLLQNEAFFSQVLTVNVGKTKEKVICACLIIEPSKTDSPECRVARLGLGFSVGCCDYSYPEDSAKVQVFFQILISRHTCFCGSTRSIKSRNPSRFGTHS